MKTRFVCVRKCWKRLHFINQEHSFITFMSVLLFRLMTVVLLALSLASDQPQETPNSLAQTRLWRLNESFIVITLFSSHHLKVAERSPAEFLRASWHLYESARPKLDLPDSRVWLSFAELHRLLPSRPLDLNARPHPKPWPTIVN